MSTAAHQGRIGPLYLDNPRERLPEWSPEGDDTRPELLADALVARRRSIYYAAKRAVDVLFSAALLAVLAPVLLAIAIAIRLDSRGPVLFTQERVGARRRVRDGIECWEPTIFRVFKFRTMTDGCDNTLHETHVKAFVAGHLNGDGEQGARFKLSNDPRVTNVGRVLRQTSLDELPQLLNVLGGTMSLVGPRPVPTYEAVEYESRQRFTALPGITGLWQVRGRCDLPFEEMTRLDEEYVEERSLGLDLKILALTVPAVLKGRGAA